MTSPLLFDVSDLEIDQAFEVAVARPILERGLGYCANAQCEGFCKGRFLFRHELPFLCPECKQPGDVAAERGITYREGGQLFGEVRVEFAYCPASHRYREIAIVRDESLGADCGTYTVQMPTVQTEKRALRVAEMLLVTLNDGLFLEGDLDVPPAVRERILDIDRPLSEIREWLASLEQTLRDNPFYQSQEPVVSQRSGETQPEGDIGGPQSCTLDRKAHQGPGVLSCGPQG